MEDRIIALQTDHDFLITGNHDETNRQAYTAA